MAAEILASAGHQVTIFERMASPGRKFLLAGRGGLNLTHSEDLASFTARYGAAADWMAPALAAFSPGDLRQWCERLGEPVFVGSSGRVFPKSLKAAPLLRAWLRRLQTFGVRLATRHRWTGWTEAGALSFETPDGMLSVQPDAVLLALGGASWPRMGSDGAWVPLLRARGVRVTALSPSNCGVQVGWSAIFAARFAGAPLKRIAASAGGRSVRGEAVITATGLEGGPIYALSAPLRQALAVDGHAILRIDLRPDLTANDLSSRLDGPRRGKSLSNLLRQAAGLSPAAIGLVQEALHAGAAPDRLGALVKSLPLKVTGLAPIERAISSAGGIDRDELDETLMIGRLPGVFAAGEMLDWEAPTGGYLLQGCFSSAVLAAGGMMRWVER